MLKKNSKRLVLTGLNQCKTHEEEIDLVKATVEGPKFFAFFRTFEDAKKTASKIPYIDRTGTVTYIRHTPSGYQLFTGGAMSLDEATLVAKAILDPASRQIATTFFDPTGTDVVAASAFFKRFPPANSTS